MTLYAAGGELRAGKGRGSARLAPALVAALIVFAGPAAAQDLTYEPVNPSFGGNPFNSSHLLGIANAQNDYRDPRAPSNASQSDVFARQLQSRLLSALSSQIVDAIFGENPQERGTITFAHSGMNTRTAQVFINLKDNPQFDDDEFVPFGEVVEGMDAVDKLYDGYGELAPEGKGPDPGQAAFRGNPYMKEGFPELSQIFRATIVDDPAGANGAR